MTLGGNQCGRSPGDVHPAGPSTLLAESDGPRGVKIVLLKPHYNRPRAAWVGGAVDCFQMPTLSSFVQGEIEGIDHGHCVRD